MGQFVNFDPHASATYNLKESWQAKVIRKICFFKRAKKSLSLNLTLPHVLNLSCKKTISLWTWSEENKNKKQLNKEIRSRILLYFHDIFFDIFKMSIKNNIATTVSLELVLIDVNYSRITFILGGQCLRWIWLKKKKIAKPPICFTFFWKA